MRKKIAAANWKMNLTIQEGKELVHSILKEVQSIPEGKEIIFAVPFPYITEIESQIKGHQNTSVAAQNISNLKAGAYTGEVCGFMLQSIETKYVIIGHSERRMYFHETNEVIKSKVDLALEYTIAPLFCCGEPLEIRESGSQNEFVYKQIEESLFHLDIDNIQKVVIAYEPIWAIGTGLTASSEQAQEMHAAIRALLASKYGHEIAGNISILYGGSVKANNATELFSMKDVDGGLVGGASLNAAEFSAIVKAL